MNKYYLIVLLQSGTHERYIESMVNADVCTISSPGVYEFWKDKKLVGSYPSNFTLIHKIEYPK